MPNGPMTGPPTDCLIPRKHLTEDLLAKQKIAGRKPRQSFGGLTYQITPTRKSTTHAELCEWLENDVLYNNWFNEMRRRGFKTFGLLPLQKGWAEPPHSKFEQSQTQLTEYKAGAQAIHKAFETYKGIIRKYQILSCDFLRAETGRAKTWQHILTDLIARCEDLFSVGSILSGRDHDWPLPAPFTANVWFLFGWLKVCWREINSCHVFLRRNFAEDDGTFGELRDPAPQFGSLAIEESAESSDDDALSRTAVRAKVGARRTDSVLAKVKRLGSKMRK